MRATPDRIAFVGLPGSGKSTIGRHLAKRLDFKFLDSDQFLEQQLGCSIREYFEREGEAAFREVEALAIDELTQQAACVLSTGGGAILGAANRNYLRERAYVVYLHGAPEDIFRRLRRDRKRPLLQVADPLARLQDLYAIRDPLYRQIASRVIETGRTPVPTLVDLLVADLKPASKLPPETP